MPRVFRVLNVVSHLTFRLRVVVLLDLLNLVLDKVIVHLFPL